MLISAFNFGIHDKFKRHHVQIPYPQRDLHLRGVDADWKRVFQP
jgi:small-conductance mechanosensitive channel